MAFTLPPQLSASYRRKRRYVSFPLGQLPSPAFADREYLDNIHLILIGEFQHRRRMSAEVMRCYVENNWRINHVPEIIRREDDIWVFIFSTATEAQEIFLNGPFNFDGSILAFAQPTAQDPFPRVDFARVPTWIEMRGLPPSLMTRNNVEFLASAVGGVIRSELRSHRPWLTAYPRVYLYLNLMDPVLPSVGVHDEIRSNEVLLAYRLGQPCYRCGRLGHSIGRCRAAEELVVRELNAMLLRVANRAGVGLISDDRHNLYTRANRGSGLLTKWIHGSSKPELNNLHPRDYCSSRDMVSGSSNVQPQLQTFAPPSSNPSPPEMTLHDYLTYQDTSSPGVDDNDRRLEIQPHYLDPLTSSSSYSHLSLPGSQVNNPDSPRSIVCSSPVQWVPPVTQYPPSLLQYFWEHHLLTLEAMRQATLYTVVSAADIVAPILPRRVRIVRNRPRGRRRRYGKDLMQIGPSSSHSPTITLRPWPTTLGIRKRSTDADEEGRRTRRRTQPEKSVTSAADSSEAEPTLGQGSSTGGHYPPVWSSGTRHQEGIASPLLWMVQ